MKDSFSSCHPAVNFLYFTLVLLFSMFFLHPYCLFISLLCSFGYAFYLKRNRALQFQLKFMLPLLLITALINPAFNHRGVTILFYLHNGNPITLESILYGLAASTMLISVLCWFSCYNEVMTSDKFIYLFGRIIPALSLIFSMVLRFVPKFKAQIRVVSNAQKCVGRDGSNGKLLERIRHGIRILSIMVTWALENAIETADSMRSRGYGLKGRTAFSIFRLDSRDKLMLAAIALTGGYVLFGAGMGAVSFRYFPSIKWAGMGGFEASVIAAYLLLSLLPVILNIWEDRKWKLLQSNI